MPYQVVAENTSEWTVMAAQLWLRFAFGWQGPGLGLLVRTAASTSVASAAVSPAASSIPLLNDASQAAASSAVRQTSQAATAASAS